MKQAKKTQQQLLQNIPKTVTAEHNDLLTKPINKSEIKAAILKISKSEIKAANRKSKSKIPRY